MFKSWCFEIDWYMECVYFLVASATKAAPAQPMLVDDDTDSAEESCPSPILLLKKKEEEPGDLFSRGQ